MSSQPKTPPNEQFAIREKMLTDPSKSASSSMFLDEHDLLENYSYGFYMFLTAGCVFTVFGIMFFAQSVPWCNMDCSNRFRGLLCNRHSSSFHPNTSLLVDSDNWAENGAENEAGEFQENKGRESDRVCLSAEAAEKTGYRVFS